MGPHPPTEALATPTEVRQRVAATVRELRLRSGRSLADLAAAADIGKSTLHAIEAGDANPGIETLWALATALGVPFGALIEPPRPAVRVLRAGEGPSIDSEVASFRAHLLATLDTGGRVEVYDIALEPDGEHDRHAHTAGVVEHVVVTAGRLRTGPAATPVDLEVGDYATFPGDESHGYEALEPGTRGVLLMAYS